MERPAFHLFPFQEKHYEALRAVLKTHKAALDASDVGAGKTIVALAVARSYGLSLFEVGPKSVLTAWSDAAALVGVPIVCLSNYESMKSGKAYIPHPHTRPMTAPEAAKASSKSKPISPKAMTTSTKLTATATTATKEATEAKEEKDNEVAPDKSLMHMVIDWNKGPVLCPFVTFEPAADTADAEDVSTDAYADAVAVTAGTDTSGDHTSKLQAKGQANATSSADVLYKRPQALCGKKPKPKPRKRLPTFHLPPRTLVVLDEVHRAKHTSSQTCALLLALVDAVARGKQCRMLLLSATLSDRLAYFAPFGVALGLYRAPTEFRRWLTLEKTLHPVLGGDAYASAEHLAEHDEGAGTGTGAGAGGFVLTLKIGKSESVEETQDLLAINRALYPTHASRIRTADLGDAFPKNQVVAQAYFLDKHDEVDAAYEDIRKINARLGELKTKEERSSGFAAIIRRLMRVELLKAPIFVEQVRDAVASGFSVVVLVKYKATLLEIAGALGGLKCLVHGGQTLEERNKNIADFQANRVYVLLGNISAAGTGVSLHDLHGRPRISLISPPWSAVEIQQALGRICRAGSKSPALQRIVFVDGTCERDVCDTLKAKLVNLKALNDADVRPFDMSEEVIDRVNDRKAAASD